MESNCYIVMYHYVREMFHSRYPGIKGLDVNDFKKQIRYLKEHFHIVRMEDIIAVCSGEADASKLPKKALLLTFDDGYIDNYTYVLPVLEENGLQGSFFIPGKTFSTHQLLDVNKIHYILASVDVNKLVGDIYERMDFYRGNEFQFASNDELFEKYAVANRFDSKETVFAKRILQTALPEKLRNLISSELFKKYVGVSEEQLAYELYMTSDQIRMLKKHGMYIGIHGYDHYWLGNLSKEKMQEDITKALEVMDEYIDRDRWVINYPYGNFNQEVINFIKDKGACIGLTTEVRVADLSKDSFFQLPRLDCNDFPKQ